MAWPWCYQHEGSADLYPRRVVDAMVKEVEDWTVLPIL